MIQVSSMDRFAQLAPPTPEDTKAPLTIRFRRTYRFVKLNTGIPAKPTHPPAFPSAFSTWSSFDARHGKISRNRRRGQPASRFAFLARVRAEMAGTFARRHSDRTR